LKHIISPYENQSNPPTDRNDPVGAATAVEIRFPETFSARAWKVINYFDDTIQLYIYKGKFVATDESLELTEYGDGSAVAPYGGPRWTGDSLEELEKWLESVADDYDKCGDMEGWEVEEDKVSEPTIPTEPDSSTPLKAPMLWVVAEVYKGTVPSLYCVKTREQVEAGMKEFINNYMLDDEPLVCVFSEEYISCEDKEQRYVFTAKLTKVTEAPPTAKQKYADPYHLHPLPLYDVCVEAMERGFSTIYDSRTLIHRPLNEFAEDIDARDYDDTYGYVRFGPIIVGLTDAWETEAEIYELDGI